MKTFTGILLCAVLAVAPFVYGQDAGSTGTKSSGAGSEMKKATKTAAKDTEKGVKTAAKDTEKGTKVAAKDTEKGAKVAAKDTEKGAEKTGSAMKKGVKKLEGKKDTDKAADTPK